jgi:hypothetical protein
MDCLNRMNIKFTKTVTLNNDDLKNILIQYLSDSYNLPGIYDVQFNVVNKPKPHPSYITDTINNWVLDGVTVRISENE